MEVDQKQLADIFGVSTRTIRAWQRDGMPAEGDRKSRKYDTEDCIAWAAANRLDGASGSGDDGELPSAEESDRRWRRARAELKELELREERRELIPADDVLELVEDVATRIRAQLLNLPDRRIHEVAAETDRASVREIRMEAVRETLEELQALFDVPEEET